MNETSIGGIAPVGTIPVVRSHELLTEFTDNMRNEYLDAVALSPAGYVDPRAVYGTNGWDRAIEMSGADPALALGMFNSMWDSLPFLDRRDLVLGSAVRRYTMAGVQADFVQSMRDMSERYGSAITGGAGTDLAVVAETDGRTAADILSRTLFGEDPTV